MFASEHGLVLPDGEGNLTNTARIRRADYDSIPAPRIQAYSAPSLPAGDTLDRADDATPGFCPSRATLDPAIIRLASESVC